MVKYIHVIQKSKPVFDSLKFMHKSYISYNKYQCEFLLWLLKQRIWFLLLINIASSLELTIDNKHPLLAGLMSFTNAVSMGMALLLLGYCTGGAFRTTVILCPNKKGVMFLSKLTEKICVIIDAVGKLFFVFCVLGYLELFWRDLYNHLFCFVFKHWWFICNVQMMLWQQWGVSFPSCYPCLLC